MFALGTPNWLKFPNCMQRINGTYAHSFPFQVISAVNTSESTDFNYILLFIKQHIHGM